MVLQVLLALLVLSNIWLYFSSRLRIHIRLVAFQGFLLAALPLIAVGHFPDERRIGLAALTLLVKTFLLPALMTRAVLRSGVLDEPSVSRKHIQMSLAAVLLLGLSVWLASHLPAPLPAPADRILATAFFTLLTGLYLCVSRSRIPSQALGVILMENGVVAASLSRSQEMPVLVELGVLLDVAVAVFVMVVLIRHVDAEFRSVDVERLSELRD
ncbi:hydrogenase-4 component E [Myxococcota bacterium]|jgi:hydrogenase-4 component E|nr:hydrogenase-4 component E [Myxococcota bacterium]